MKSNISDNFGKMLKQHRKNANYTQGKLAELAGVSPQHIQRLEGKNLAELRLKQLRNLRTFLSFP